MHDVVHERIIVNESYFFMQLCNAAASYSIIAIVNILLPIWLYLVSLHIFNRRMSFDGPRLTISEICILITC